MTLTNDYLTQIKKLSTGVWEDFLEHPTFLLIFSNFYRE